MLDSNAFRPGGSRTYRVRQAADGATRVELQVIRRGRTLKGRLLATLLQLTGRAVFCGDLRKTLAALEQA